MMSNIDPFSIVISFRNCLNPPDEGFKSTLSQLRAKVIGRLQRPGGGNRGIFRGQELGLPVKAPLGGSASVQTSAAPLIPAPPWTSWEAAVTVQALGTLPLTWESGIVPSSQPMLQPPTLPGHYGHLGNEPTDGSHLA